QQHARRHERDFLLDVRLRVPSRERLDVVGFDERVVLAAQQILEENLHRVRQLRDSAETGLLERGEAIYLDRFSARANLHARIETVSCGHTNRNDTSLIRFQVSGRLGISFATAALEVSVMDQNKNTQGQQDQGQQKGSRSDEDRNTESQPTRDQAEGSRDKSRSNMGSQERGTGS